MSTEDINPNRNPDFSPDQPPASQTPAEKQEERRKIRRLQLMVDMVRSVLYQDPDLTPAEASELIANCKTAALAMFPDKELAFDLIYKPRLQRVFMERFRPQ
jgi:hypothetical protein